MKFKKLLSFAAATAMAATALLGSVPMTASADYTGSAGGVEWRLNTVTYVLTFSKGSTGIMPDYSGYSSAPWYSRRTQIKSVVVEDGVTNIGNYAFGSSNYSYLEEVTMADSVTSIGNYAFYQLPKLATVTLSDNLTSIGDRAFMSNSKLETVQTTVTSQVTQPKVDENGDPVMVDVLDDEGNPVKVQKTDEEGNLVYNKKTVNVTNDDGELVQATNEDGDLLYVDADGNDTTDATAEDGSSNTPKYETEEVDDLDSPVMVNQQVQDTETVTVHTKGLPSKLQTIGSYAFYNDKVVTGLTLPNTLTTIGDNAFESATNAFDTINLSSSSKLAEIGQNAFKDVTSLTSFSCLSTSLTELPLGCFRNCSNLESFSPSTYLTTIGNYAFAGCTSLTDSFWTSGNMTRSRLNKIGDYAFQGCTGFTSLANIPSGVKTIGSNAFADCSNVTTARISNTSSDFSMGTFVFSRCSKLTDVTLPTTLTEIPSGTFYSTGITSYTVPAAITKIGTNAFGGCTDLASVTFPSYNLKEIDSSAFADCSALTSISLPSSVTKLGASAFKGTGITFMLIPEKVTEIPNSLLQDCTALTSVSFPDDVTTIGSSVFKGDTSLTSITLPKNLETVSALAFQESSLQSINAHAESTTLSTDSYGVLYNFDKSELIAYPAGRTSTSFTIPSSVETIMPYAFSKATKLTSISFPTSASTAKVAEISNSAFEGCIGLRSVTIPRTVEKIGTYAFSGCTAMTSLTFTGATSTSETSKALCETIGASAFRGCTALTSVTTPNSLTSLGNYAFYGCTNLATLTLNNGLESIGDSTFENDAAIKAISIPDTVTALGQKAFKGCSAATTLKISKNIEEIKMETFHSCTSLKSATIPSGVKTLGNSIFYGCTGLEEATIPNSVATMGTYMFQNAAALEKVVLSNKLTTIPNNTFYGCTNEDLDIYILGSLTANPSSSAFGSGSTGVKGTIYVYDDNSYTRVSTISPVTSGQATLKYGANFSALKEKLAEVAEMDLGNYTDASASVLDSAIMTAESVIANYAATQGQTDAAVDSINKAISNLVVADNKTALVDLAAKIESAEKLIASDYQEGTYATLTKALEAAKAMDDTAMVGDIKKAIAAIDNSINGLVPSYAYPDVIKEVMQSAYETFLEGTATAKMAGAEKVKVTFDMAPNCAYNQMTEFKFKASVNSKETAEQKAVGSGWPANGTTGHTGTFNLDAPLKEGDQYWFYGYTYNWSNHVFTVRSVELLNGNDEVVFSTKDVVPPTDDLIAAVESAKAADTTGADADKVAELEKAIKAAEAIVAKAMPLPSEIDAAKASVDAAVKALSGEKPPVSDPNSKPSVSNSDSTGSSDKTDPTVTDPTTASTNVATTRNPEDVKKDKAAAKKAMKQAKISKLKVNSKKAKKINVTWKKVKKATGYQVQVSTKKNFKKVIFKKDLKKTKLTIKSKKIKSKKTYYVRVRAYATYKDANGKNVKVFSKWNKKLRKVKVK